MVVETQIDASPTKEFFIEMLTRDIPLDRSILDLIDNSVDAAKSNGTKDPEIRITMNEDKFLIWDNCGGIPLKIAKDYAFRFGRPKERENTSFSVGQFGVGMKRTLFKLGNSFRVMSNSEYNPFSVDVDVQQWKGLDEWKFNFTEQIAESLRCGETIIEVNDLFPSVSDQFNLENFVYILGRECSVAHFKSINSGLKIYINDKLVDNFEIKLKSSEELKPVNFNFEKSTVKVKITAGISERSLKDGGWYIVCNGRLISSAEQTTISGWRLDGIPQYHPDYAFFRGIVEFEADDSSLLPWTTTKTGVDKDNFIYKAALFEMKKVMREVIPFLRLRAKEDKDFKDNYIECKPLNDAIEVAPLLLTGDISDEVSFTFPEPAIRKAKPSEATIQYKVSLEQLSAVKKSLGVTTNYEVGEETFKYYVQYECD
ncbi:ATP-binding protein [Vibrio sp. 10N.222.48.A8]|uniref:ATP-binding protein n=1 Tax=Vibrio sp. 10N.222.48.A8 TaxID=3229606 RepID=UPI00354CD70C